MFICTRYLINIFVAVSGQGQDEVLSRFKNSGMAEFKGALADAVIAHLAPISRKMAEFKDDRAYLEGLLRQGSERAGEIARQNITQIKNIMGFLQG